jgi:hypothetical protein
VFCVWYAEDEEAIKEHSRRSGFPVTAIRRIRSVVDAAVQEG